MTRLHEVAQNVTSVRDTVAQNEHAKDISERAHNKSGSSSERPVRKGNPSLGRSLKKSFWLGIGLKE